MLFQCSSSVGGGYSLTILSQELRITHTTSRMIYLKGNVKEPRSHSYEGEGNEGGRGRGKDQAPLSKRKDQDSLSKRGTQLRGSRKARETHRHAHYSMLCSLHPATPYLTITYKTILN